MAHCGVPTFTCLLLILSMGALYARASSRHSSGSVRSNVQTVRRAMGSRIESNANIRGRQGRVADSGGPRPVVETRPRNPRPGRGGGRRRTSGRRGGGRRRGEGSRNRTIGRAGRRTLRRARRLSNATSPFTTQLLEHLYPEVTYDTVFSPHSIHAVMTMTLLGARGRTERQISTALGLRRIRLRGARGHRAYQALLTSLGHTHRDVHVLSANAVFVKPNIPLELNFRRQLQIMYFAKFDSFHPSRAAGPESPINAWVANQTRGKIPELLAPGTIDNSTAMLLINALYLNASWAQPFYRRMTQERDFHSFNQGLKRLETMQGSSYYRYVNHHNTEVVELPYKGDRLAMYILLPHQGSSIQQLIQYLTSPPRDGVSPLETLLTNMQPTFIMVTLPKFQIDSGVMDVSETLQQLGIVRAFQMHRANFTGISVVDLYINKVVHKCVIEVNEDGTAAAAGTAVHFSFRSSPVSGQQVTINRPFVFLVRDKTMQTILFMGTFLGQARPETR